MASDVLRDYVLKARPDADAKIQELVARRLQDVMQPLMGATSARGLRTMVERAMVDYVPILETVFRQVASELARQGALSQQLISVFQEVLSAPEAEAGEFFSPSDKRTLLDAFRLQTRLNRIVRETPIENTPALINALIDGYWASTKVDLCVITARLVLSGELAPQRKDIPHWLCLAMRHYLNQWQSALFANNPVLQARLMSPDKTVSHEEAKLLLGL